MGGPGSGGFNRKPTALKLISGTFRPNRARNDAPKPRPIISGPPRGMDPVARRLWRRLAPRLQELGLLTELDGEMFVALCGSWTRYQEACQRLRETIKAVRAQEPASADGLHRIRKGEISVSAAEQSFKSLAREFGLSPVSRGRLDVPSVQKEVDAAFEEFLDRAGR